jgi:hypothetical protein
MLLEILAVYALLTSALFYLGSRAVIMSWLWGRYPPRLARFMDCAACSGFWYGLIVGGIAWVCDYPGSSTYPAEARILGEWWSPFVVALCSVVWTPIVAGFMQAGFERLGSAVGEDNGEA